MSVTLPISETGPVGAQSKGAVGLWGDVVCFHHLFSDRKSQPNLKSSLRMMIVSAFLSYHSLDMQPQEELLDRLENADNDLKTLISTLDTLRVHTRTQLPQQPTSLNLALRHSLSQHPDVSSAALKWLINQLVASASPTLSALLSTPDMYEQFLQLIERVRTGAFSADDREWMLIRILFLTVGHAPLQFRSQLVSAYVVLGSVLVDSLSRPHSSSAMAVKIEALKLLAALSRYDLYVDSEMVTHKIPWSEVDRVVLRCMSRTNPLSPYHTMKQPVSNILSSPHLHERMIVVLFGIDESEAGNGELSTDDVKVWRLAIDYFYTRPHEAIVALVQAPVGGSTDWTEWMDGLLKPIILYSLFLLDASLLPASSCLFLGTSSIQLRLDTPDASKALSDLHLTILPALHVLIALTQTSIRQDLRKELLSLNATSLRYGPETDLGRDASLLLRRICGVEYTLASATAMSDLRGLSVELRRWIQDSFDILFWNLCNRVEGLVVLSCGYGVAVGILHRVQAQYGAGTAEGAAVTSLTSLLSGSTSATPDSIKADSNGDVECDGELLVVPTGMKLDVITGRFRPLVDDSADIQMTEQEKEEEAERVGRAIERLEQLGVVKVMRG